MAFIPPATAYSSVRPPTRPKYIKNTSTRCEASPSPGVMPTVRPTVAMALAVSYRAAERGTPSHSQMAMAPARNSPAYSVTSVAVWRSTTGGKRRENT